MKLRTASGEPLAGGLAYVAVEETFLFAPARATDVPRDLMRSTAILVGTLQLQVDVKSNRLLYIWGKHPRTEWSPSPLLPPSSIPGVVTLVSSVPPETGAILGAWSTTYDESSGWIRVAGDDDDDEQRIEIAGGTIIGCREGNLHSIWLRPRIIEGDMRITDAEPDPLARGHVEEFPSISGTWTRILNVAPMPWSLGIVGDLVWNVFPQLRPQVRELILLQIDDAIGSALPPVIDLGPDCTAADQLTLPSDADYVIFALGPTIINDVSYGAAAMGPMHQLCRLLRLLLTYDGDDAPTVGIQTDDIIESLMTMGGIAAVTAHDPELAAHIWQLGMWTS